MQSKNELHDAPTETTEQRTSLFLENQPKGKPAATIENLERLLNFHNIRARYNIIAKKYEVSMPAREFSVENSDIAAKAHILSEMKKAALSTEHYREYMTAISEKNRYNPVLEWIRSVPWDGEERIPALCATVSAKHEEAKNLFIRRWLLIAAALGTQPDGVDAPACLVFQGRQDLGKTWWFRRLCAGGCDAYIAVVSGAVFVTTFRTTSLELLSVVVVCPAVITAGRTLFCFRLTWYMGIGNGLRVRCSAV
jgi:putative DNA primase/helicase